jgi:hypothetical protein
MQMLSVASQHSAGLSTLAIQIAKQKEARLARQLASFDHMSSFGTP